LYAFIVVALFYVVTDYKRSLQQSRATTKLVREFTLAEARLQDAIDGAKRDEKDAPARRTAK
jgi:hypothetical protein